MLVVQLAKHHAIAATLLSIVHCPIGCIEERARIESRRCGKSTADRDGDLLERGAAVADVEGSDAGPDFFGDYSHSLEWRIGQNDDEFLAPITGYQVLSPRERRPQDRADRPQVFVAGGMAEPVVEFLKVVDVDHQERDVGGASPRIAESPTELLVEGAAIGKSGEGIDRRGFSQAAV